ncbi:5945_t:CDS:2 [Dentiscutata heterogama]|uniref:5945_t:CDS:1 n=1 Tax=Dentiscutata heterogama TaxID=1316150 RepID=A0ACA9K7W4_9GLOM|nr:5945_t:CDS:2 [Dentiscutata heterogama]
MDVDERMSSHVSSHESYQSSLSRRVAISPDGLEIATFDPNTSQILIYDIKDLKNHKTSFNFGEVNNKHKMNLSLAISDPIDNGTSSDRLIALSKFYSDEGMNKNKNDKSENWNDIEKGEKSDFKGKTWIISLRSQAENKHYISIEIGGVVRFLDNESYTLYENSSANFNNATIVITNASGIFKRTLGHSDIEKDQKDSCWCSLTHSCASIEGFNFPEHFSSHLNKVDLLHTSIVKNHFFVHSYKNKHRIVEMYSLRTGNMEMIFKKREPSYSQITKGRIIYEISQNEALFAFCHGTNAITIYLMENGLEIITKKLRVLDNSIWQKILSIHFIDNDSKLFIIYEEELYDCDNNETKMVKSFIIWDLFSTSDDAIKRVKFTNDLKVQLDINPIYRLLNSNGKILGIKNDKDFFWVLQHPEIRNNLYPTSNDLKTVNLTKRGEGHIVYDVNGKMITDSHKIISIIENTEPWNPRTPQESIYLDKTGNLQLIIGSNTLQVWRLKHTSTNKRHSFLEIHWPNNVNVLESACRFLNFVTSKKHEANDNDNLNRLIESTQRLIYKFIKQHGTWRLTDIRYNIMENLIKAEQYTLIKLVLNESINGKNCKLHLPRRYKWNKKKTTDLESLMPRNKSCENETFETKTTDLESLMTMNKSCAIATIDHLLEYYLDNAYYDMNSGWLFTVTDAIHLLYDNKINVQKLFKKPCFGALEADTSPLNLSRCQRKTVNEVHILEVKPQLARKPKNSLWTCFKEKAFLKWDTIVKKNSIVAKIFSNSKTPNNSTKQYINDEKVYMVPLPNFTIYSQSDSSQGFIATLRKFIKIMIYPRSRVISKKNYSPFLHVIDNENDTKMYNCPSIIAATEFK